MTNKKKYLAATMITVHAFFSFIVQAAVLNVAPPASVASPANVAPPSSIALPPKNEIVVSLNTEGESVNAVEGRLIFNPQEFLIQDIYTGGSVVSFWIKTPKFSNTGGTVDFSGIIPGGITASMGTLFTIAIAPKQTGISHGFAVASARVLRNDGKGTPAVLVTVSGKFPISPIAKSSGAGMPEFLLTHPDTQAPNPFIPKVARDPALFGGKHFLVFAATDQHSGIDHYEVLEAPQGTLGGDVVSWQKAASPYLLQDQTLSSDVYVRAVDKANNFRVVKIPAAFPGAPRAATSREGIYLVGFGILLGVGIWLFLRRQKRFF